MYKDFKNLTRREENAAVSFYDTGSSIYLEKLRQLSRIKEEYVCLIIDYIYDIDIIKKQLYLQKKYNIKLIEAIKIYINMFGNVDIEKIKTKKELNKLKCNLIISNNIYSIKDIMLLNDIIHDYNVKIKELKSK